MWIKARGPSVGTLATGGPDGIRWLFAERASNDGATLLVGFSLADDGFDPASRADVAGSLHRFFPEAELMAWDWHDWIGDPWARGTWVRFPMTRCGSPITNCGSRTADWLSPRRTMRRNRPAGSRRRLARARRPPAYWLRVASGNPHPFRFMLRFPISGLIEHEQAIMSKEPIPRGDAKSDIPARGDLSDFLSQVNGLPPVPRRRQTGSACLRDGRHDEPPAHLGPGAPDPGQHVQGNRVDWWP